MMGARGDGTGENVTFIRKLLKFCSQENFLYSVKYLSNPKYYKKFQLRGKNYLVTDSQGARMISSLIGSLALSLGRFDSSRISISIPVIINSLLFYYILYIYTVV